MTLLIPRILLPFHNLAPTWLPTMHHNHSVTQREDIYLIACSCRLRKCSYIHLCFPTSWSLIYQLWKYNHLFFFFFQQAVKTVVDKTCKHLSDCGIVLCIIYIIYANILFPECVCESKHAGRRVFKVQVVSFFKNQPNFSEGVATRQGSEPQSSILLLPSWGYCTLVSELCVLLVWLLGVAVC